MNTQDLLRSRGVLEERLRKLIGRAIFVIELDVFALPCGCSGLTANTRGLELDDLEVFEPQLIPHLKEIASGLEISSNFIFARLVPGSSVVAALNWRNLCKRCYSDFSAQGRIPRPDLYIMHFSKP